MHRLLLEQAPPDQCSAFPLRHGCFALQSSTDYGPYLANEASPLHTTTIVERCTEKLVDDWNKMRANVSHKPDSISCSVSLVLAAVRLTYGKCLGDWVPGW